MTEESSNKVLYELMVKHALPAAATYDLFCVKIKVVNIGSEKNPVKVLPLIFAGVSMK